MEQFLADFKSECESLKTKLAKVGRPIMVKETSNPRGLYVVRHNPDGAGHVDSARLHFQFNQDEIIVAKAAIGEAAETIVRRIKRDEFTSAAAVIAEHANHLD